MAMLEFNVLLRVGMSTYYGNLDYSEWICERLREDLHEISDAKTWRDNWMVKCKMLDGSEKILSEKDIDEDFSIDWKEFSKLIVAECEHDIDGSVMTASDHKFDNMKELLAAYWMEFKGYEWFMPKYYNYDNDSLDLCFELTDMEWSLEKYLLTELVKKYIDEVRVESYDWYQSFEPTKLDDVVYNDYCVMWAILQKEWVFDYIQSELQELVDYHWYEIYDNAVKEQHWERREDTMPDKWDWYYQDRYKIHYFKLVYGDKYLQEVEEKEIYPPKND